MRVRLPRSRPETASLRLSSLLQRAIIVVAALAMLMFALPLATAVTGLYRSRALEELARDAERARTALTAEVLVRPELLDVALPRPHDASVELAVYRPNGARLAGAGPIDAEDWVLASGRSGVEEQGSAGGSLYTALPISDGQAQVTHLVRASMPLGVVQRQVYLSWALMTLLAAVILLVVAAAARSAARRIAQPLQQLAESAEALGRGDFSVRHQRSGVSEVDDAGRSLERTARRLGGMLERERAFSADASHQLRTPLTAVRLGLEAALLTPGADLHAAAQDALGDLDRLERTVLDLLALARDTRTSTEVTDVGALVQDVAGAWRRRLAERGRALAVRAEPQLPPARVSAPALRTVLDVLLGNALTHGAGPVTVVVRANEETLVLEVGDEGPGVVGDPSRIFARRSPDAKGTGIGLALARSLVEADGGRLELTAVVPARFAVLVPLGRPGGAAAAEPQRGGYVAATTGPGGS